MTLVRRLARPALSAVFVTGGIDTLKNPAAKVPSAQDIAPKIAARLPWLPQDTKSLVTINAAMQVGAGLMLATGRLPRLSAALLAGSLVPTTLAGHRFWEIDDPQQRTMQRIQFTKNVSMLGGLLLAAVDTEGRPGVAWRAQHAAQHVGATTRRTASSARDHLPA